MLLSREAAIWDPSASSVLNINKAAGNRNKKANTKKSWVKNNPRKNNLLYMEADITTHLAAVSQTLQSRQGIERKKQVAINQR
jgi:hypothetical protein